MAMSNAERQAKYRANRIDRMAEKLSTELPADVRHGLVELAEYHGVSMKDVLAGLIRSSHVNTFGKTTQQSYDKWLAQQV